MHGTMVCLRTSKFVLLVVASVLAGCASAPSGPVFESLLKPPVDAGLVYVARPYSRVENRAGVDLVLDGAVVATLRNSSYTILELPPGTYTVSTRRSSVSMFSEPWNSSATFNVTAAQQQAWFIGMHTKMTVVPGPGYAYVTYDVEKRLFERWPDTEIEGLLTALVYQPAVRFEPRP